MEYFMKSVKEQYETNLAKWKGKEDIHQLITVCVEEFGEMGRCILEGKNPNPEIIDLVAVLFQIYEKEYK